MHVDGKIPFVYDIADLFKRELVLEPAFELYSEVQTYMKEECLARFKAAAESEKIMKKIPDTLKKIMGVA